MTVIDFTMVIPYNHIGTYSNTSSLLIGYAHLDFREELIKQLGCIRCDENDPPLHPTVTPAPQSAFSSHHLPSIYEVSK